ncbi:hypothetical protein LAZ40_05500 [Cereibacter sphaeroides]|uniref:hypothetical protein n=1 Tax=Cereibacter sphaeroides TaxID=1063 RepID=UPI001F16963A|nr:hypothetical protein [Cereibacter sphaeroides]MCE6958504.1 hypothetical protein [Cereibacter sphaeroides]MCE6972834.1 hypothetical protein [Cereibacter sphaeroides]
MERQADLLSVEVKVPDAIRRIEATLARIERTMTTSRERFRVFDGDTVVGHAMSPALIGLCDERDRLRLQIETLRLAATKTVPVGEQFLANLWAVERECVRIEEAEARQPRMSIFGTSDPDPELSADDPASGR